MVRSERKTSQDPFGPTGQTSTVIAECLVPHWTLPGSRDAWDRLDLALSDLQAPRRIRITGSTWHDKDAFDVVLVKATSKDVKSRSSRAARFRGPKIDYSLLQFTATLAFPGAAEMPLTHSPLPEIGPPHVTYFSDDQAWNHWNRFLPDTLSLTIQTFLMSVCITYAGAVRSGDVRWTVNGHKTEHAHQTVDPIGEAMEYLSENNLEPSDALSLDVVHRWVCSKNGIFDGYGDSPSSKSLNLFTRLFSEDHREDEMTNLIWALAGIEALLVKGGRSSSGQLREKLNAIFEGRVDQKWLSAVIEKTYDYRSRMVHGHRPLRSHFRRDEED